MTNIFLKCAKICFLGQFICPDTNDLADNFPTSNYELSYILFIDLVSWDLPKVLLV